MFQTNKYNTEIIKRVLNYMILPFAHHGNIHAFYWLKTHPRISVDFIGCSSSMTKAFTAQFSQSFVTYHWMLLELGAFSLQRMLATYTPSGGSCKKVTF